MLQKNILEFLLDTKCNSRSCSSRPKFVDLFCGIGGASQGAAYAGYDVILAVDMCAYALAVHRRNHPNTRHMCIRLQSSVDLPLPGNDERWHLHGSPPCTFVSRANQERNDDRRTEATATVDWYLRFAMDSNAETWSMEQVATPVVIEVIKSLKKPNSPYRSRLAYVIVDLYNLGVPQRRRRLIAGPPSLIASLSRCRHVHRSVSDVISHCRGTHVRNEVVWGTTKDKKSGIKKRIYYSNDKSCLPISGPGYCITATHTLRWATPGSGLKLIRMTPTETALMQTFPVTYKLDKNIGRSIRGIGNALPPVAMKTILLSLVKGIASK
jgi:DNA (cytosine-5)-methyltransferase 1